MALLPTSSEDKGAGSSPFPPFFIFGESRRVMMLEIVYLDPHSLTPYEGNARKHGTEDVEQKPTRNG